MEKKNYILKGFFILLILPVLMLVLSQCSSDQEPADKFFKRAEAKYSLPRFFGE